MQAIVLVATGLWSCMVFSFASDAATALVQKKARDLKIEWGVSGRKGMRKEMQDAFAVQSENGQIVFSLYDGHGRGGAEAAFAAASFLPHEIIIKGEELAYPLVDNHIERSGCTAGTTAVSARVLPRDDDTYDLILAWAGDSRAVLCCNNGLPHLETIDHKPEDLVEQERILNAGGVIYRHVFKMQNGQRKSLLRVSHPVADGCQHVPDNRRISGLSFTRALGDAKWSNILISPEPEIITTVMQPGQEGYLILGSDGLWDTVSTDEAAHIVSRACPLFESLDAASIERLEDDDDACAKDNESTEEAGSAASAILTARALRDAAYNHGSSDNITALVVRFIWEKKHDVAYDGFEDSVALQDFGGLVCCVL